MIFPSRENPPTSKIHIFLSVTPFDLILVPASFKNSTLPIGTSFYVFILFLAVVLCVVCLLRVESRTDAGFAQEIEAPVFAEDQGKPS